jgi:uncharacterized protein YndB with AHSA1/START domain
MATQHHRPDADGVMEQADGGQSVLRFTRHLAHPVDRVWAALTREAELIQWWGEATVDLTEGGAFTLRWLNTDDQGNTAVLPATVTTWHPRSDSAAAGRRRERSRSGPRALPVRPSRPP